MYVPDYNLRGTSYHAASIVTYLQNVKPLEDKEEEISENVGRNTPTRMIAVAVCLHHEPLAKLGIEVLNLN